MFIIGELLKNIRYQTNRKVIHSIHSKRGKKKWKEGRRKEGKRKEGKRKEGRNCERKERLHNPV
jgi:hypothetical protein